MTRSACPNPANELLPWYLNGSLENGEEETVRSHLSSCPVCAAEMDTLTAISRGIAARPLAILAAQPAAPREPAIRGLVTYGLAAALVMAAVLGLYRFSFPQGETPALPDASRPGGRMKPAFHLDLDGGPARDLQSMPGLVVRPGPEAPDTLAISFRVAVKPRAVYHVELEGPRGASLLSRKGLPPVDPLGRCTYLLPVDLFRTGGSYAMVVIEETPAEERRLYRYPFDVATAPVEASPHSPPAEER